MTENVEPLTDEELLKVRGWVEDGSPLNPRYSQRALATITALKETLLIKDGALEIQGGELARAMEEHKRLREALEWYEQRATNCRKITSEGDVARRELDADGGNKARSALKTGEQAL